ncbi:phosphate acetyltransferase [Buchnera aphidicola]|uniref:phosphate acetyltransferase n=1 Tax=Buchnera aphidicola TaxID=9 RepID=UPI003463A1A6
MSRIIMLVPLNKNVGLKTISLSLLYYFYIKEKNNHLKSFSYFPLIDNSSFDKNFIKEHFLRYIDVLDNINFSKKNFNSDEYLVLVNRIIKECYNKKKLNEFILIQGINKREHFDADQINFDIAQNTNAEVILLENLEQYSLCSFKEKEKQIKGFLENKKYKNILGVIYNNINSPFIKREYTFFDKLTLLNDIKKTKNFNEIKKKIFFNSFFSVIALIPWNKNFFQLSSINISNFLNAHLINEKNLKNYIIKNIMIFEEEYLENLKKISFTTLVIVSSSRIDFFLEKIYLRSIYKKIGGILFTGLLNLKKNFINKLNFLINQGIPIFFVKYNIIETLSRLEQFNFNIQIKSKNCIKNMLQYFSKFFKKSFFLNSKDKVITFQKTLYSPKEFCYRLTLLSKKKYKRIIFPESYETRILKAVSISHHLGIAECVLLGNPKKIYSIADENNIYLSKKIEIIDPFLIRKKYISRLIEIRKNKGMDEISAQKELKDNIVLATLILESDQVDGMVSGAVNTTANTIRPALQIIKTNPMYTLVSSIFFMLFPDQVLVYGDCAINIEPNAQELADIAIQSADSAKNFSIKSPRIAMLSYSTGYSGMGQKVEKIRCATKIVQKRRPDLIIDGPIQYDAAISKEVAQLKAPLSTILGNANVFIFPDLNSGNIAYKAVQRSANLICIGPMLQGLRKPVNDLSRGASVQDIIYTIALTSIQSS